MVFFLPIISNRSSSFRSSLEILGIAKFDFNRTFLDRVQLSSNSEDAYLIPFFLGKILTGVMKNYRHTITERWSLRSYNKLETTHSKKKKVYVKGVKEQLKQQVLADLLYHKKKKEKKKFQWLVLTHHSYSDLKQKMVTGPDDVPFITGAFYYRMHDALFYL